LPKIKLEGNVKMKFSSKLENLRKSKNMSQEELAQKLNVTRQTISKWELDQTVPDMNKLIEISKLFGLSLDELVNDIDKKVDSEKIYKETAVEKKNKKIALRILIIGIIISLIICGIGFLKQKESVKINEQAYNDAYNKSKEKVDAANNRLSEIDTEMENLKEQINNMETEISTMKNEKSKIFRDDRGFSDRYYSIDNEINAKKTELSELESQYSDLNTEAFKLKNDSYIVYYDVVEPIKYLIFYYIAGGVISLTVIISLIYFLITRKK
jgi:transcriptional regulator with XRE-family HTH domain